MVNPGEFWHWYYLIYLLPGGIALLILLLSTLGGGMRHHHAAGGHRISVSHSPAGAARHHTGQKTGPAPRTARGAYFGIGRVPLPLVWGSALLGWGLCGFWGTQLWQTVLHRSDWFVLPALAGAFAGAFVMEKVTVETAARLLPHEETFATDAVQLCGLTGTTAFPVDSARGRVHVYDVYGTLHDMSARTAPDGPPLPRGRRALVIDYDPARDQVIVEEVPG